VTEWMARVAKNGVPRLVCGKQHPVTHRYLCQGVIATLQRGPYPRSWVPDPPESGLTWGEDRLVRPTKQAERRDDPTTIKRRDGWLRDVQAGKASPARYRTDTPAIGYRPAVPYRRVCPDCAAINIVSETVLDPNGLLY
jgi:hypothetical protein